MKNGAEKKASRKEKEKDIVAKEAEKSFEKNYEKKEKATKGTKGKKREYEDSEETQLPSKSRDSKGPLTSKRSKLPEPENIPEQVDCGSDDDESVVETQRFSRGKLKRLDERKFRLTNKNAKFQVIFR